MLLDRLFAAARRVVLLRQVFGEHPFAEAGFVPGDVVAVAPRLRGRATYKVEQRPDVDGLTHGNVQTSSSLMCVFGNVWSRSGKREQ